MNNKVALAQDQEKISFQASNSELNDNILMQYILHHLDTILKLSISLTCLLPKPLLKIKTANAIFWIYLGIFRNKTFLFFKILIASAWYRISWNLPKFYLIQLIQTIVILNFSIDCLIDLKFRDISWNSFSNRWWKFQFSILKNKKQISLKCTKV